MDYTVRIYLNVSTFTEHATKCINFNTNTAWQILSLTVKSYVILSLKRTIFFVWNILFYKLQIYEEICYLYLWILNIDDSVQAGSYSNWTDTK